MNREYREVFIIISVLTSTPFIALIIPVYLILINTISINELLFSIIFLVLIPLLLPYYWSLRRNIEWDYPIRRERILPFSLVTFCYFIGFLLSIYLNVCPLVRYIHLSYAVTSIVALLFTLYYKISIHVMGIVGPATILYWMEQYPISIPLFLLSVLVGYARVKLKRHTIDQVLSAYITAFTINTLIYYMYKMM